jgi:hypothetical protein
MISVMLQHGRRFTPAAQAFGLQAPRAAGCRFQNTNRRTANCRPEVRTIVSSNSPDQFAALMAPALLVELSGKSRRHPRRLTVVGGIAGRAGRAWRPAVASVTAVPRSLRMAFADPAAIATGGAGRHHRRLQRDTLDDEGIPFSHLLAHRKKILEHR